MYNFTLESDSVELCVSSFECCSIRNWFSIIWSCWLAMLHSGQCTSGGWERSISENLAVTQLPHATCKHSNSFGESDAVKISEHQIHFGWTGSPTLEVSSTLKKKKINVINMIKIIMFYLVGKIRDKN